MTEPTIPISAKLAALERASHARRWRPAIGADPEQITFGALAAMVDAAALALEHGSFSGACAVFEVLMPKDEAAGVVGVLEVASDAPHPPPEKCPDCGNVTVTTHPDGSKTCGHCYVKAYPS